MLRSLVAFSTPPSIYDIENIKNDNDIHDSNDIYDNNDIHDIK